MEYTYVKEKHWTKQAQKVKALSQNQEALGNKEDYVRKEEKEKTQMKFIQKGL